MPRFRPPLDPFVKGQPDLRAAAPPHVARLYVRDALLAVRPALDASFDLIQRSYADGASGEAARLKLNERIMANNMSWDGLGTDFPLHYWTEGQRVRTATIVGEVTAEALLLSLDGIMSALVHELTGKDAPLDVGALVADTPLDRLLDAAGNFGRHKSEWRAAYRANQVLSTQALRSVEPLARALSGNNTVSGQGALAIIFESSQPMLSILDIIADYESDPEVRFQTIEDRCVALAESIIAHAGATSAAVAAAQPVPATRTTP